MEAAATFIRHTSFLQSSSWWFHQTLSHICPPCAGDILVSPLGSQRSSTYADASEGSGSREIHRAVDALRINSVEALSRNVIQTTKKINGFVSPLIVRLWKIKGMFSLTSGIFHNQSDQLSQKTTSYKKNSYFPLLISTCFHSSHV